MGLLRVLHLGAVGARGGGDELLAVGPVDLSPHGVLGLVAEVHRVRTHVGDVATLVQALGDAHDLGGTEAQLAPALLLEGGGHERGLRRAAVGLLLHGAHGDVGAVEGAGQRAGAGFVHHHDVRFGDAVAAEVLPRGHLRAVEGDERGGERRAGGGEEVDVPVRGGDEGDPLPLALHDQAHRRALHPAGGQAAVDPAPQHRRDLVAVQAVQQAAGLCGVDQPVVDATRVGDGVVDGGLGDLVEDHPLHRDLRLQVLQQVPGDGLALAVFVRREVELVGVLHRGTQVLHHVLAAQGQLVGGLEPVVHVDLQPLARQVGHMAHRGAHVERVAEELGDRFRLGRRLHDDEGFGHGEAMAR